MSLKVRNITFDCKNPFTLSHFWAAALGYNLQEWHDPDGAACEDPTNQHVRLLFIPVPEGKIAKNRLHLDIMPSGTMEAEVQRLLGLGATIVHRYDVKKGVWTGLWTVMADPEGNEFCIESGPLDPGK